MFVKAWTKFRTYLEIRCVLFYESQARIVMAWTRSLRIWPFKLMFWNHFWYCKFRSSPKKTNFIVCVLSGCWSFLILVQWTTFRFIEVEGGNRSIFWNFHGWVIFYRGRILFFEILHVINKCFSFSWRIGKSWGTCLVFKRGVVLTRPRKFWNLVSNQIRSFSSAWKPSLFLFVQLK